MPARRYRVLRAAEMSRDLELIGDYLVRAYQDFGDERDNAEERAEARIGEALDYMRTFAKHPHRGTEQATVRPGVRTVTHKGFVFYFEVDDSLGEVRILAAFFGGADHRRQIVERLRG